MSLDYLLYHNIEKDRTTKVGGDNQKNDRNGQNSDGKSLARKLNGKQGDAEDQKKDISQQSGQIKNVVRVAQRKEIRR